MHIFVITKKKSKAREAVNHGHNLHCFGVSNYFNCATAQFVVENIPFFSIIDLSINILRKR